MTWGAVAGAAISVVGGGLLGSKGQQQSQTSQNTVDPRFAEYMYGGNGVLPAAQDWYSKNKGGMNEQMATGMNNQWNQLGSSAQGYNQMQNLGMGLMGGGVAGNPFSGGNASGGAGGQSAQSYQPMQSYQPAQMSGAGGPFSAAPQQAPQQAAAAPAQPKVDPYLEFLKRQQQIQGGGGEEASASNFFINGIS